ncbi:MAG: DsrE/DsrF/DrsH-like family protein [Deltaproteobacteria bacterium]|nr:DsrE/DsrF/DrsH-like family protein [Deltaproteobacteria bacterium]
MGALDAGNAGIQGRVEALEREVQDLRRQLEAQRVPDRVSLICFSGDWDRLFAALTIASGALAMGQEVHLFFTFWAVTALRKEGGEASPDKALSQSMLGSMLPVGPRGARLSKMHFFGLGKVMMKRLMKKHGVEDIDALMKEVRELGGQFHLCETSSGLFGLGPGELVDGESLDRCGVATFLSLAFRSRLVLFV